MAVHRYEVAIEKMEAADSPADSPENEYETREHATDEAVSQVIGWIRELPRQQLSAVWFRALFGFSYKDVALAMGCSLSSAKTHYWRGITLLRRRRADSRWATTADV
jgi:DNA-directed RNA polymerase specialized sigma24 family protein